MEMVKLEVKSEEVIIVMEV